MEHIVSIVIAEIVASVLAALALALVRKVFAGLLPL
jgi:hypothetical protein